MASIHFYIRDSRKKDDKDKNDNVSIWVRVRDGEDTDIRQSAKTKVTRSYWDKNKERIKVEKSTDKESSELLSAQNDKLAKIEKAISKLAMTQALTNDLVKALIQDCCTDRKSKDKPTDMLGYLGYIINEMKSGNNRFKGRTYDEDTIKVWQSFHKMMKKFATKYPLTWTITPTMYNEFVKFLQSEGYMIMTQNKFIARFKAFIKKAINDNMPVIDKGLNEFHKQDESIVGTKTAKIYLNEKELKGLYKLDLKTGSKHDKVRDVFLLGCYLGQRVSDYANLKPDNFSTTEKGTPVVRLQQEKTNNEVVIPILFDEAFAIINKYKYQIPNIASQIIDREIKIICRKLSVTTPSLKIKVKTKLTMKEIELEKTDRRKYKRDEQECVIKERWELVTTHCARRSCITNLYLQHKYNYSQLMAISGHKSIKEFESYISLSKDEAADDIADVKKKSITEELF